MYKCVSKAYKSIYEGLIPARPMPAVNTARRKLPPPLWLGYNLLQCWGCAHHHRQLSTVEIPILCSGKEPVLRLLNSPYI